MYILIMFFILVFIIILFRKKFFNIVKKIINNKRILICLISFIIVTGMVFIGINYIKNNPQEVEKNKCEMVESYILQEYKIDGKVKASWFTHHEFGDTGGLYMYTFKVKDKNNKIIFIDYNAYKDLSEETLDNLKIRLGK